MYYFLKKLDPLSLGVGAGITALGYIPAKIISKKKTKVAYEQGVKDGIEGKKIFEKTEKDLEEMDRRLRRLER